jgi:hypothetical protein
MDNNTKNPANAESTLFRRLTKLFSGPLTNRKTQMIRNQRRQDLDKYRFKSASGQNFKKATYNPFESINSSAMANQQRGERYVDFDQMEYMPELASALDIYADEMTTSTSFEDMLKIKCHNEEIKSVLETLFHQVLNVDFNLFGWCRTMCKYGDMFLYLDIDDEIGIKSVVGLPTNEVERLEGEDPTNSNYVQFQWNSGGITFENWQIAHFRILGNDKYVPYGSSILEPARRIWRQLTLLEDAMMAYRVVRSPERRVFYIDVGAIAPEDVEQYMQKIITQMKRNQVIDQETGRVDLRYNPMSIEEDYFLPVRGDNTNTRIEALPGGTYTGDIDDVKYLRDKLFSAIKIPPAYLSRAEGGEDDKTTLAQKDIRFSRTVQRLQRAVLAELEKIGIVHLYTLGFRGDDLISFDLLLNNPSKIAELQELETWNTRFTVASTATEGYFSKRWIAKKVFGMTEEEFLRNQREMFTDRKMQSLMDAAAEMGAAEAGGGTPGMGAGEMDFETDMGMLDDEAPEGADALEGGDDMDAEVMPEPTGEDETLLAAPPGKRDDKYEKGDKDPNVKKYAKSKYTLTKNDKRPHGARKRHYTGKASTALGKNTERNIWNGSAELFSLGNGIAEDVDSNYKLEEKKVFDIKNTQREIKTLVEQLEKNKYEKDTQK